MSKNIQKKLTWQNRIDFMLNFFKVKLEKNGIKPTETNISEHLKISRGKLKAWMTGQVPNAEDLEYIVQISSINPLWLFLGKGEPFEEEETLEEDIELCMIPLVAATLSAGNGSFEVDGNIEKHLAFRRDFLRAKGSIKDMVLMTVAGDSMSPDILHKDTVLIDQSQKRFVADGIYAVGFGETIYLKKINALPNKILLESINKQYEPIIIEQHEIEDSVRILGRAIWWCREAG